MTNLDAEYTLLQNEDWGHKNEKATSNYQEWLDIDLTKK